MIAVGCQTYTWEMLGDAWTGPTDAILDAIAVAGYTGLELTLRMAGDYRDRPDDLRAACAACGLTLRTLAFSTPTGFTDPQHAEAELVAAEAAIAWARRAGCATLGLGGATLHGAGDRRAALRHAALTYNAIAQRAVAAGLVAHVHPSSHHGSVIETIDDYEAILDLTDPALVGFGPDTGHLLRGGIDPIAYLRRRWSRVVHVHLKDVASNGDWAAFGTGQCDTAGVVRLLRDRDYAGWLMLEDESDLARADPAGTVACNRAWLRTLTGL
jgi:sugar phosphate isomerase/epimerase